MTYRIFTERYDREVDISAYAAAFNVDDSSSGAQSFLSRSAVRDPGPIPGTDPVILLLDCSGSMRGANILAAIAALRATGDALDEAGREFEVLGFTTSHWKGGLPMEDWKNHGRPENPGRLNSLLHLRIKSFDQDWETSSREMVGLLTEGLLKENIDGEALQWAYERSLQEGRNAAIIVLSDGQPVDQGTLSVNREDYLRNHLKDVIRDLVAKGVDLRAVNIAREESKGMSSPWPDPIPASTPSSYVLDDEGQQAFSGRIFEALSKAIRSVDLKRNPEMSSRKEEIQTDMKRFIVSVPDSTENSDYIVDAADARGAARLYLEASISEGPDAISCDTDEIVEAGRITCRELPESLAGGKVLSWEDIVLHDFDLEEIMADYEDRLDQSGTGEFQP